MINGRDARRALDWVNLQIVASDRASANASKNTGSQIESPKILERRSGDDFDVIKQSSRCTLVTRDLTFNTHATVDHSSSISMLKCLFGPYSRRMPQHGISFRTSSATILQAPLHVGRVFRTSCALWFLCFKLAGQQS